MDETSEYFLRMFVSRAGKTGKLTICPGLVLVLTFLVVPVGRSSMNSDLRKKHLVNGHLNSRVFTISNHGKSIENNKTLPGVRGNKCIKLKPAINSNKADSINIEDLMTSQSTKILLLLSCLLSISVLVRYSRYVFIYTILQPSRPE